MPQCTSHCRYRDWFAAPSQQLVKLWSSLLNVPLPSPEDNFFDLGGHSLMATQLTLEMRKVLSARAVLSA